MTVDPCPLCGDATGGCDPVTGCASESAPESPGELDDMPDKPKVSQATKLVDLAGGHFYIGRSQTGDAHAVRKDGPYIALDLRGGSSSLRSALAHLYVTKKGGAVPSSSALADAMLAIEGRAQMSPPTDVHVRIGNSGDMIVLDVGTQTGAAIAITSAGWSVLDRSPILFRRTELTGQLPTPVEGGDIERLRHLLNIDDGSWPLLLAWLVSCLITDIPHPILCLFGEQGTGKTSASKMISATIDPSPAQVRTAPRDDTQWAVGAAGSWIIPLDNVSHIPPWLSDCLCKAVTGDGFLRRKLYSDSGLSVLAFQRCIILNSIDTGALRGDLGDRLLIVDLERIEPSMRRSESAMKAEWVDAHPHVLGGLLDLTVAVLKARESIVLDSMPRMADFAIVVAAVDAVLGTSALETYSGQVGRIAEDVIESDAVAEATRDFMSTQTEWSGTATALKDELTPASPPKSWPSTPRGLSGRLRRAAPSLGRIGLDVEFSKDKTSRQITLTSKSNDDQDGDTTTLEKTGDRPSFASRPSTTMSDQQLRGDAKPEGDANDVGPSRFASTTETASDQHPHAPGDAKNAKDDEFHTPSAVVDECAFCGDGDRPGDKLRMRDDILYHLGCGRQTVPATR